MTGDDYKLKHKCYILYILRSRIDPTVYSYSRLKILPRIACIICEFLEVLKGKPLSFKKK